MHAIKIETTVDEATAQAIPGLRPLLGKRVELIALETESKHQTAGPAAETPTRTISFEELLSRRTVAAPGTPPLNEEDIEAAIIQGALDGNV